MKNHGTFACVLLLLASPAIAAIKSKPATRIIPDEIPPVLYSRAQLAIYANNANQPVSIFDIEVRDAKIFFREKGWFNLSSPSDLSGLLLAYHQPTIAPLLPSTQYAPLDVLFLNQEGTIMQIMPNLVLAELNDSVRSETPTLALLLLKGGACTRLNIRPNDHVDYKIFSKPPTIINQNPPPEKTVPAPQPVTPADDAVITPFEAPQKSTSERRAPTAQQGVR
jgi:uncharacterized membrane protein (UPF0127 family)